MLESLHGSVAMHVLAGESSKSSNATPIRARWTSYWCAVIEWVERGAKSLWMDVSRVHHRM